MKKTSKNIVNWSNMLFIGLLKINTVQIKQY